MRRLPPALLAAALFLAACASAPQLGAGASVTTDACGNPVVKTTLKGAPAGPPPWVADAEVTVYQPCAQRSEPVEAPGSAQEAPAP